MRLIDHLSTKFKFSALICGRTDKIYKSSVIETFAGALTTCSYLYVEFVVLEKLTSNNITSLENITILWTILINLTRYQLPKTLIRDIPLFILLKKTIIRNRNRSRYQTFLTFFCMLKIHNIM
jgi:hypothetical protein